MAKKKCTYCGKGKGWFESNYAGLDIKKKDTHPYPERIKDLVIPGDKKKDFICGDCVNKNFKVECLQHGPIEYEFVLGLPPVCNPCKSEKVEMEKLEV
ncbi:MAG: hypothetical protein V3W19_16210 [Desulfatiglandales bacterium]